MFGYIWVITDHRDLSDYKLLVFDIPCDTDGNVCGTPKVELNANSGLTYNHKRLWASEIKNNSAHKPYNKRDFGYYPRGRVDIGNNRATIYLNPNISKTSIVEDIKQRFGLSKHKIGNVRVAVDGSVYYQCFMDWE